MRSTGAITTVECAGSPASKTLSRESRDGVGGVGVGGAQLCKSGKAGAASSVVARARSSKDGPARQVKFSPPRFFHASISRLSVLTGTRAKTERDLPIQQDIF